MTYVIYITLASPVSLSICNIDLTLGLDFSVLKFSPEKLSVYFLLLQKARRERRSSRQTSPPKQPRAHPGQFPGRAAAGGRPPNLRFLNSRFSAT